MTTDLALTRSPAIDSSLDWKFLLTIPMAGAIHMNLVASLDGLSITGFIWSAELLIAALLLAARFPELITRRVPMLFSWWVFLGWMWVTLMWCDGFRRVHIQTACLVTVPFLIGALASVTVRSVEQLPSVLKSFFWILPLVLLAYSQEYVRVGGELAVMGLRHGASYCALLSAVFLSSRSLFPVGSWLAWLMCLALPTISTARTATGVIMVLAGLRSLLSAGWFVRSLVIASIVVLGGIVVSIPHFQQRMLYDVSRGYTLENIRMTGRGELWPLLLAEALGKHPWIGGGIGSSEPATLELTNREIDHPHNDYLRILYEQGAVGLAIFAWAVVAQSWRLLTIRRRTTGLLSEVATAATLAWFGFLLTSLTSNTLIYAATYTCPMFFLIGCVQGLAEKEAAV